MSNQKQKKQAVNFSKLKASCESYIKLKIRKLYHWVLGDENLFTRRWRFDGDVNS